MPLVKRTSRSDLKGQVKNDYDEYQNCAYYWKDFFDRGIESVKFYGGDQWSVEDLVEFQNKKRPIVTINRIAPIVRQVSGLRTKERVQPRVRPERNGTSDMALLYNRLLYFVLKKSDYQQHNYEVNEDQVVTGRGWWEMYRDTDEKDRPMIRIGHADWNEIIPHPNARDLWYRDAPYMFRVRWLSRQEIIDTFGVGDELQESVIFSATDRTSNSVKKPENIGFQDDNGNFMVIQKFYFEKRKMTLITDGETIREAPKRIPEENLKSIFGEQAAQMDTSSYELMVRTSIPSIQATDSVDISPFDIQTGFYPFVPAICYKAGEKLMGVVEDLKDEQRRTNKAFSQIIEILGYSAKGLWTAQEGTVDQKEFEQNVSRPGGILFYKGQRKPEYTETARLPQGYAQIYDASEKNFMLISGVVPALEGRSEFAGESGVKFAAKLEQAREQLSVIDRRYTDSFTWLCKLILKAIPQVYTDEFVFNCAEGNDPTQDMFINFETINGVINDVTNDPGEYDVNVDIIQERSTIRQTMLAELAESMAQLGPQFSSILVAEWVRGSDIENKDQLANKLELLSGQLLQMEQMKTQLAMMNQQAGATVAQGRVEQGQRQGQAENAKTVAEIEKMKADAAREDASANVDNLTKIVQMVGQNQQGGVPV